MIIIDWRTNFKTSTFVQFLCLPCGMRNLFLWGYDKILNLEIFNIFNRLKFSPSLTLNSAKAGNILKLTRLLTIIIKNLFPVQAG